MSKPSKKEFRDCFKCLGIAAFALLCLPLLAAAGGAVFAILVVGLVLTTLFELGASACAACRPGSYRRRPPQQLPS